MSFIDPSRPIGRISLVGAGPGAADLLTLRALRCLEQADVVFYDRLVSSEVLDLCPAHAEKVFVGKEVGAHSWPQSRIDAAIVAAALKGRHVVRLKSGDPSIFGRAAEEIAAARAHGIPVAIVPGITAASAAAASLGRPLTERGRTDRLVLATATCRPGDDVSDITDLARPGTTLVFYMAMQQLDGLSRALRAAGVAGDHPVTVAHRVSSMAERVLTCRAETLAAECQVAGLRNPAVILVELPKEARALSPDLVQAGACA